MFAERKLSEKQRRIQDYLVENRVEEILADLLNTLAHALDPKPVIFMIKYLSTLCTKEDLTANGVTISGQLPHPNLAIMPPTFATSQRNHFKTALTPEVFGEVKDKKTGRNITLRNLVAIALENEAHPIGIFAPDESSYSIFSKLFDPILENLNRGVRLTDSFVSDTTTISPEELEKCNLTAKESKVIKSMTVKVRRNLHNHAFNVGLLPSERKRVKQEMQDAIMKLDSKNLAFHPFDELSEDAIHYVKEFMKMNKFTVDRPQALRYKDWPSDRTLALNKVESYCILLNKEDHFELVQHRNQDVNFSNVCASALNTVTKLESHLHFAKTKKYGYISTNPKYVGLGLKIKIILQIPEDKCTIFRANLASIDFEYPFLEIKELPDQKACWVLKNTKMLGYTEADLFRALKRTISFVLTEIVEPEQVQVEENITEPNLHESKVDNTIAVEQQTKIDILRKRSLENEGEFTLEQFIQYENNYPTLSGSSFGILKKTYFVVRRNVEGFPLKDAMTEAENITLVDYLREFAMSLPTSFIGEILDQDHYSFQEAVQDLIEKYDLKYYDNRLEQEEISGKKEGDQKWAHGAALFRSFNQKLFILTNLEDHYTLIYNFEADLIVNALNELSFILQTLQKKTLGFVYDNDLGFQTVNPLHTGSGTELTYILELPGTTIETVKPKAFEKLEVYERHGNLCLRVNRLYPTKIKNLLELVVSLLQDQKRVLYTTQYQQTLKGLYPATLISKIESFAAHQMMTPLDTFDSYLEIQPYNALYYELFAEPYLEYLKLHKTETISPDNTLHTFKKLSQVNIDSSALVEPDAVTVKVELGRNFRKYPFKTLMTTSMKAELNDLIQDVFSSLKVEGDLLDAKEVKITRPEFRSIYQDQVIITPGDKAYVPTNSKFVCWINTLDHVRLVSQVPVRELKTTLKLFESIVDKLEEEGHEILSDEKFGFMSQKLDLCGLNVSFRVQVHTTKGNGDKIMDLLRGSQNWIVEKEEEEYRENKDSVKVVLTSKGPAMGTKLVEDISAVVELAKKREEPKVIEQVVEVKQPEPVEKPVEEIKPAAGVEPAVVEEKNVVIEEPHKEEDMSILETLSSQLRSTESQWIPSTTTVGDRKESLDIPAKSLLEEVLLEKPAEPVEKPQEVQKSPEKVEVEKKVVEQPVKEIEPVKEEAEKKVEEKKVEEKVEEKAAEDYKTPQKSPEKEVWSSSQGQTTEEKNKLGLGDIIGELSQSEGGSDIKRNLQNQMSEQGSPQKAQSKEQVEENKERLDVSEGEVLETSGLSNTSGVFEGDKQDRKISQIFKKYMSDSKTTPRRSEEGGVLNKESGVETGILDSLKKTMSTDSKEFAEVPQGNLESLKKAYSAESGLYSATTTTAPVVKEAEGKQEEKVEKVESKPESEGENKVSEGNV